MSETVKLPELDARIRRAVESLRLTLRDRESHTWRRVAEQQYQYLTGLLDARKIVQDEPMSATNPALYDQLSTIIEWAKRERL